VLATGGGASWSAVEAGAGGAGVTEAAAGAEEVRRDVVDGVLAPPGGTKAGPHRGYSATGTCSMTVVSGGAVVGVTCCSWRNGNTSLSKTTCREVITRCDAMS
jgi:hypothetical protein